jgi:hypothetical protein
MECLSKYNNSERETRSELLIVDLKAFALEQSNFDGPASETAFEKAFKP